MAGPSDSSKQQPESLATFDKAAKSGGVKPPDQGVGAVPDTAPKAGDLKAEQKDAARILEGGAKGDTGEKDAAIARRRDEDKRSG